MEFSFAQRAAVYESRWRSDVASFVSASSSDWRERTGSVMHSLLLAYRKR